MPGKAAWSVVTAVAVVIGLGDLSVAQEIGGRITDAISMAPVREALVVLHPNYSGARDSIITDTDGRYAFAVSQGQYVIEVRHIAYVTHVSRLVSLQRSLEVNLELEPATMVLGDVEVVAERLLAHMERGGYYDRQAASIGRMIEREEILRRRPRTLTDLMRGIPGVLVEGGDIRIRNHTNRTCWPTIVLDDVPLRMRGERLGIQLDGLIVPEFIEAIEVHTRATGLPSRYGGRNSPCGAILIWSHRATP